MATHTYKDKTIVISRVPMYGTGVRSSQRDGEKWKVTVNGHDMTKTVVKMGMDTEQEVLESAKRYIDAGA